MKTLLARASIVVLLAFFVCTMPSTVGIAQTPARIFPETGKTVSGRFLQYREQHGGLTQQGFPISEEIQEQSPTDGCGQIEISPRAIRRLALLADVAW